MDVGLIDVDPHAHRRRIDHVEDRHAGAHLLALAHLRHRPLAEDAAQHDQAVERRRDAHLLDVVFGMPPGVQGALLLDLQDAHVCRLHLLPQGEGLGQLLQARLGLLERLPILLGRDRSDRVVADHAEPGDGEVVRCLLQPRLAEGLRSQVLAAPAVDLLLDVAVLRLAIADGLSWEVRSNSTSKSPFFTSVPAPARRTRMSWSCPGPLVPPVMRGVETV